LDRELRPPATINVLLDLIRRIESGDSIQNDREFAIEIIHRFKQDGIVRTRASANLPYSIPYSPKGVQSDKYKLLLRKFITGDASKFPNETLTNVQGCSLHFMISNSVNVRLRGDESLVCSKLGRYQRRMRRGVNPDDQVEIFEPKSGPRRGNLQEDDETHEDVENPEAQVDADFQQEPDTTRQKIPIELSDCPVENGVVYTRWGTITPGSVIAGIAAGRQPIDYPAKNNYVSDSKFATTLAGDLAEAALHQGVKNDKIKLGVQGDWNSMQSPRWYYIKNTFDWEMTAAEIRGGLDGLIIAKNIKEWKVKFPSLKLSQIIDMYYSPKGVFSSKKYRACNRQDLFTEVAPREKLLQQTIAFSLLLDDVAELPASINTEGIKTYSEKAVDTLLEFVPTNLHDLRCGVEGDTVQRASTDIIIVLDSQWDYIVIQKILSYLLDNLDVNKYGSNYTIISAKSGKVLVNSTESILEFHINYTRTDHLNELPGFDANQAFQSVEQIVRDRMIEDKVIKRAGGQSTIALFLLYNPLNQGDKSSASGRKDSFRQNLPDLKLLALGRGSKDAYTDLVIDATYDAFGLTESSDGTSITQSLDPVIDRIKEIHRKIINPNCGPSWSGSSDSFSFDQYIEPNSINYYRVAPNYFFGEGTKTIEIQGYSYGNLAACMSRQNARPTQNGTQGEAKCDTVTGNGKATFTLTNGCDGYEQASQCSPAYFSVQSTATTESTTPRCTDAGCRFPDDIKFTIKTSGFGCESGALAVVSNIILLISMYLTLKVVFFR